MNDFANQETNEQIKPAKQHSTFGHWLAIIIILALLGVSALVNIVLIAVLAAGSVGPSSNESKIYTEELVKGKGKNKVVCIEAFGIISFVKTSSGLFQEQGLATRILKQIEQAEKDDDVVAILLIVDSPGGGVTASDIIYDKLTHFKNSKKGRKVVALLRDLAASGGYYISAASDKIVAHRTTVTGSIGVILSSYNIKKLGEKIGIKDVTIKSGKYKDILNPFRDASPEEITILQDVINDLYSRFVSIVATNRNMTVSEVKKIANGSIYSAPRALSIGLIDEIGTFETAVNALKNLTGKSKLKFVKYKRNVSFFDLFSSKINLAPKINLPLPEHWSSRSPAFQYLWQPEF